ncbi:MAG: hypothetical protein ACRCX2_07735, partial [Paraclostridium sp.]
MQRTVDDIYDIVQGEFMGSFNADIIHNNRRSENLVDFIDKVGKTLEVLEYIKYDGYTLIEDEGEFDIREICRRPSDPETTVKTISREKSRVSLVKLHYTITYDGVSKEHTLQILIPKLYNKNYFLINGNKIYPIYQIVDSSTYIMKNTLVLKTTMMPLRIKANIVSLKDIYNVEHTARNFTVSLYKEIPMIAYYLATVGLSRAIEYLLGDNILTVKKKTANISYTNENTITFNLGDNLVLIVDRDVFDKNDIVRSVVSSLISTVSLYCPELEYIHLNSITYWRNILGKMIYTKANKMRGKSLLVLFERVFDEITRDILRVDPENKEHTYAVTKWLVFNFDELMHKDNLSMDNKRARLSEYMVIPLNSKFSYSIHRLLDSNKKKMSVDYIISTINIHPTIIIDAMVNSGNKAQISKLTRFSNSVNDMDLISALKYSLTGPQSIGSGSSNSIPDSHRFIHPSHIGRVDIMASSAGSPGTSGSLLPLGKMYGMYFSDKGEPQEGEALYKEALDNHSLFMESIHNIPTVDIRNAKDPETGHTICSRNLSMKRESNIGIDT